jgi:hypothetical protein
MSKEIRGRFPSDFMFRLAAEEEATDLKCQIGVSKPGLGGLGLHVREVAPRYRARKRA